MEPSTILYAALDHYDTRRDPDDHVLDKVLPDDLGVVHAVSHYLDRYASTFARTKNQPIFLSSLSYDAAWCGRYTKVILPVEFDPADPDACPACVDAVERGTPVHRPLRRDEDDEDTRGWINDTDRERLEKLRDATYDTP